MSIFQPEVASLFGALDSLSIADGEALSSHLLRVLAMTGNHLTVKGQPLFNLPWPIFQTITASGAGYDNFTALGWLSWVKILPTITIPKVALLNRASLRVSANVTNGQRIYLQFATLAKPFDRNQSINASSSLGMLGTGAFANYDLDEVPISEGGFEQFEIYARGSHNSLTLGDTATYGSPNAGTITETYADRILVGGPPTWNKGPNSTLRNDWASGGHFVDFLDAGGNQIATPRQIIGVGDVAVLASEVALVFTPPLTPSEQQGVQAANHFQIVKMPGFTLSNIAAAAQQRVL